MLHTTTLNKPSPHIAMANQSPEEVFRFFDLPPELRNRVYDCLSKQVRVRDQCSYLHKPDYLCFVQNAPISSVLMASRQLSHEYEKQRNQLASSPPVTLKVIGPTSPTNPDSREFADQPDWPHNLPERCAHSIHRLVIYSWLEYLELCPPGPRSPTHRRADVKKHP